MAVAGKRSFSNGFEAGKEPPAAAGGRGHGPGLHDQTGALRQAVDRVQAVQAVGWASP